ncbi:MAG: OmpA family protein, partial [candidate division WOR-3 bacterium]
DSIAQVLKDNPTMKVEIGGHADERGTRAYNYRLTDARANSVRTYFITKHGIDARRLIAIGYGEDRPVVPNAKTEEEHQLNRRVEFKILGEIK